MVTGLRKLNVGVVSARFWMNASTLPRDNYTWHPYVVDAGELSPYQLLEVVGADFLDVLLDLGPGLFHSLFVGRLADDSVRVLRGLGVGLLILVRAGDSLTGGLKVLPSPVFRVDVLNEFFAGELEGLRPGIRQFPATPGLQDVPGLDEPDRVEVDDRPPADVAGLFVGLLLVIRQLQLRPGPVQENSETLLSSRRLKFREDVGVGISEFVILRMP